MPLHVSSTCAHRQEAKIVLYNLWYHHTCWWPSGARVERRLFSQPVPPVGGHPVHGLREESSLNLCTGRPPTGVMIPEVV